MKKITLLMASMMLIQIAFAGGLVTNSNQSVQFIRMLSRNASTDIDAVYFNPAGLIKLQDGWHFAFSSQTIFQDKTTNTSFPLLNNKEYVGEVSVPVFPTGFAVYKKQNFALSLGFGPNGGGGSAEYKTGMPSFEIPLSKAVPALAGLTQINPQWNVQGYGADLYLNGSSVYWGLQLGLTYKVSDMVSVYGGVRYLPATTSYDGHIKNIQLNVSGQMVNGAEWLTQTAASVSGLAAQASQASALFSGGASELQPIVAGGYGSFKIDDLSNAGVLSPEQRAQMEGGLRVLNFTNEEIAAMDIQTIQGAYTAASKTYADQSTQLTGTATTLSGSASQMADKKEITEQTGTGITPMIGVNISPNEKLNIALKYEMGTNLELTNKTEADDFGLFPDGGKSNNNIPALLALGVGYKASDLIEGQLSYTMYFDKGVDWGPNIRDLAAGASPIRMREIDNNMWELALGLQFNVAESFAVSVGGIRSQSGIAESYQSDFSHSNPSSTLGLGFKWNITEKIAFDAGFSNTFYEDQEVTFTDPDIGTYKEVYGKTTMTFAAGLSFSIF